MANDVTAIDEIARLFFAAFDNRAGKKPDIDGLRRLFIDGAVIVKVASGKPQVMSVDAFITPREALLTDGALTDFHEWEEEAQTSCFGGIAWRHCTYRKSGTMNGTSFGGAGMKVISFALLEGRWRIASVLWQDEEDGLRVPPA
jgi:hypothetical protein